MSVKCLKIFSRLQKLLLCVSHNYTLKYLDKIGEDHDAKEMTWKQNIEESMIAPKVIVSYIGSACAIVFMIA